jgi:hypothetical protein
MAADRVMPNAVVQLLESGFAASGPLFRALRALTRNHPGTIPEPTRNQPGTNPGPARRSRVGSGLVRLVLGWFLVRARRARNNGPLATNPNSTRFSPRCNGAVKKSPDFVDVRLATLPMAGWVRGRFWAD